MEPFLGEIRTFPWSFAPKGWALCNGALLPINQNAALFSLLGTTYGGNGQTTFALPNLQGRTPLHFGTPPGGSTYVQGQQAGVETVILTTQTLPAHSHAMNATTTAANQGSAGSAMPAAVSQSGTNPTVSIYTPPNSGSTVTLANDTVGLAPASGSQPHSNLQPLLGLNFCIATSGIFPSRN